MALSNLLRGIWVAYAAPATPSFMVNGNNGLAGGDVANCGSVLQDVSLAVGGSEYSYKSK